MPAPLTVAVTGATGYVGSAIADALRAAGHTVIPLTRNPSAIPNARPFELGHPIPPGTFTGIDALVHCAWDFAAASTADIQRVNVDGSLALFDAARAAGVRRTVFISTMSAFAGCRSKYGKAKLDVERRAIGASLVRPGLVHGPRPGGMVGALEKVTGLPVIPLVGAGGQTLFLTHQDDLGQLIATLVSTESPPTAPIIAANDEPHTFKQILRKLAAARNKRPLFLPFPWQVEWLGLKSAELIGLRLRLRADSLISLINQDPHPDFAPTRAAGTPFRPFTPVPSPSVPRGRGLG